MFTVIYKHMYLYNNKCNELREQPKIYKDKL